MYLSHFNFNTRPFRKITGETGDFFVPYHQDVYALLAEKTGTPGIVGLFSEDAETLSQFTDKLRSSGAPSIAISALPKLSANTLLYKLNPTTKGARNKIHAIDAILQQWLAENAPRKHQGKVLIISAAQALKDNCCDVLGMLQTRAQELAFPLTVVLTGTPDQEPRLLQHSGLHSHVHTRHTLRPLTCREFLNYVQAQTDEQQADVSPFTPARVRKMHALTKGSISKLNQLAHLALLAAWTERAAQVSPRHLRLAAGETLPPKRRGKQRVVTGLLASVLFAACGWFFSGAMISRLPVQPPIPVSWKKVEHKAAAPVVPVIENEMVNQPDAMHQLYAMWGYDTSANEALCQNASQVNLMCRQGNASLQLLEKEGYPWISEVKTGDHLNYAVVARVEKDSLDLLMNNRTWQVSRGWFNQHATGNYTLLHRLTPQGKDSISATSSRKDLEWLDQELSQSLAEPVTHSQTWTTELAKRTREFQNKAGLHVDGIAGEETLMQLMRATNSTPAVLMQTAQGKTK